MIKNIILEKPVSWIESNTTGHYVNVFYNNLLQILKSYNLNIKIIDVFYAIDGGLKYNRTPEFDNSDTLYISYHTYGIIIKNLFRIKENYLPGFFSIDPKGYSGFSELADLDFDFLLKNINYTSAKIFIESIKNDLIKNNSSKYSQNKFTTNNIPKNAIFFPLQVQNDTVMELTGFNFYDLIDSVCKNISYPIIIKPHPYSIDIEKLMNKLENISSKHKNIIISQASVHQILASCECCMTINSGVGFEALIHNKPTITFGKSDYAYVSYNCDNKKDINDTLINKCITNHNEEKNIKFLYYYLKNYCVYYTDTLALKNKIKNELLSNSK